MTFTTIVAKLNFPGDEHEKGHVNPSGKDVSRTGTPKITHTCWYKQDSCHFFVKLEKKCVVSLTTGVLKY
jgi:hypothetical protein